MSRTRLGLAVAGLIVSVIAVLRDDRRISWVAIALLSLAFALRFVDRRR